jgi:uncharacterized protein (DUF1800 family)
MSTSHCFPANPQRRRTLQALSAWALGSSALGWSAQASAQTPSAAQLADAWRAMSRVGYGPSPTLQRAVLQGPPRSWALQQIERAYAASMQPPRISKALAGFNAPLPQIFEGFRNERQTRAAGKETERYSRQLVQQTAAWRLASCSQPDEENPLLARMTEFWFNHLNVFVGKGAVRPFVGHYLVHAIRANALGRFEDLLLASARHPAMLFYLDQAHSVAEGSPGPQGSQRGLNENYARELMELHTLGVDGGYTQTDVRELARVLTGWTINPKDASGFRFATRLHDTGAKRVLGTSFGAGSPHTGEQEGVQAIRMLARHPATAKRIGLRLAQFFVADHPSAELVQRLAYSFMGTQGDIRAVLRTLLQSPEFWNSENRLFKTPLDFACSALSATGVATQTATDPKAIGLTLGFLNQAGQPLHGWQTPDGYKTDAATWLVPEALTRRADYALAIARQTPELDFLLPYLSANTRDAIAQERPGLRAGLMLASPDFMYK